MSDRAKIRRFAVLAKRIFRPLNRGPIKLEPHRHHEKIVAERLIVIKRDGVLIRLEQGDDSRDVGHLGCHNARVGRAFSSFLKIPAPTIVQPGW